MAYTKTTFVNGQAPAVSAEELNKMGQGIEDAFGGIQDLTSTFFGSGGDGNVTISSNTTLSRVMYYDNLTINSGRILDLNGYVIFVRGRLTNHGTIKNSAISIRNRFDQFLGHSTGGAGVITNTGNGKNGNGRGNSAGGNGGNGGGANQYNGGTGGNTSLYNQQLTKDLINLLTTKDVEISGGAGGGSGALGNYGVPGMGGNGGPPIWIFANEFENYGIVDARGGAGGNASPSPSPNNNIIWQSAGGGGGGGGGAIVLVFTKMTRQGTLDVSGGAGGARCVGGSHTGTDGSTGSSGSTVLIKI